MTVEFFVQLRYISLIIMNYSEREKQDNEADREICIDRVASDSTNAEIKNETLKNGHCHLVTLRDNFSAARSQALGALGIPESANCVCLCIVCVFVHVCAYTRLFVSVYKYS